MIPVCNDCNVDLIKAGTAGSGRTRYQCPECKTRTTTPGEAAKGYDEALAEANVKAARGAWKRGTRRFLVTSVTNDAPLHTGFLTALEAAAEHFDAELWMIPIHYKNISLFTASQEYKKAWPAAVTPYLMDGEVNLPGLVVDGDTNIAATAADPLSGLHDIGGTSKWRIFGHPQLAMQPVAMPGNRMPKRVYTTGSISRKSYSATKAGKKADFHHTNSALLIEYEGRTPFIRQLSCDSSGAFYDLNLHFDADGVVSESDAVTVLATGDEHAKFMCPKVKRATYTGPGSMVEVLRPEYIVRQDIFDAYSVSHHHERSPLQKYRKHVCGDNLAAGELDHTVKHINDTTPEGSQNVFVSANHHDHLDKWLDRVNANDDPANAHLILELQKAQRDAVDAGECPAALPLYLKPRLDKEAVFLDRSTPFIPNPGKGADYSQHGDVGVNGSRGSARGLAKSALKMTVGHSHSAHIVKGVYQVGKSTGRLEYENGLSTHTNTHCIEYPNGKRTLIDIVKGKWRAAA